VKRLLWWSAGAALASAAGVGLVMFAVWLRVAPPPGHWTVAWPVEIARWRADVEVSVPKLLQAITDPALAKRLDGRRVASPVGPLSLHWDGATLSARCAPCLLRVAAFAAAPVRLDDATLELRRAGEGRYEGRVVSGGVVLPLAADVSAQSMTLRARLPPTPIAALVALFGAAVPEARSARIDGTLAARVSLAVPQRRWRLEAIAVDGFAVHGLGTEALAHATPPPACAPLPPGRIPPWLERAVIAAEDQRYAEHPGYDSAELRRALEGAPRGGAARGASTITQQLARLLYTGDERSLPRKLRELLYAVEMERTLGKGRILRLYLALAPWGDGVCGAESAARHYFGKSAARLDAHEAAWLAVRLRAPTAPAASVTPARVAPVLTRLKV
jgi:hypothetical protein